jgi:hypothetical protein
MTISLRTVTATRYVAPLREGGSLPGLMEADDLGTYVVKFRGAGQGVKTLTAELITGEIGRLLGLSVPEIVFVELDPVLAKAEPDPEIQQLLAASSGLNIALDFLPGALPYSTAMQSLVDPALAARVVWLDALTTNIDRTPRNPNLLIWHRQLWLIDHGASIYLHHSWTDIARRARTSFPQIADHVLLPISASIREAGRKCRPLVTRETVAAIVDAVPENWLAERAPFPDSLSLREAYVELILTRLEVADAFEVEADDARTEVQG